MAANLEGLRERWERMNSREQRLMVALGITFIICILGAMVFKIQDGMKSIEAKNIESRKALRSLAVYRNAKAKASSTGTTISVPEKAIELDSYLEGIISELELTSPTYPALKSDTKGEYVELSFSVTLKGLSILQLKDFLQNVEKGSNLVVIKELEVDRNFRDKEKLDLDVTVATFKKAAKAKEEESSEKGDGEEG